MDPETQSWNEFWNWIFNEKKFLLVVLPFLLVSLVTRKKWDLIFIGSDLHLSYANPLPLFFLIVVSSSIQTRPSGRKCLHYRTWEFLPYGVQGFIQAIFMFVIWHKKLNLTIEFWNAIFIQIFFFVFCLITKLFAFVFANY